MYEELPLYTTGCLPLPGIKSENRPTICISRIARVPDTMIVPGTRRQRCESELLKSTSNYLSHQLVIVPRGWTKTVAGYPTMYWVFHTSSKGC